MDVSSVKSSPPRKTIRRAVSSPASLRLSGSRTVNVGTVLIDVTPRTPSAANGRNVKLWLLSFTAEGELVVTHPVCEIASASRQRPNHVLAEWGLSV